MKNGPYENYLREARWMRSDYVMTDGAVQHPYSIFHGSLLPQTCERRNLLVVFSWPVDKH